MNSHIITDNGISLLINSKPYVVHQSHENFSKIMDAVKANDFDAIPALINKLVVVADKVEQVMSTQNDVVIDVEGGIVTCQGDEIPSSLSTRLIRMVQEGFDVAPMSLFITNLFSNPSKKTIDELYTFLEYGNLPITPDGCFVAYKRVNFDYTDCHTGYVINKPAHLMTPEELAALTKKSFKTGQVTTSINAIGKTEVTMPRRAVNDRSEETCSSGLHFCSYEYLSSFDGARVIVVKINPADVVSIPVDYNNTKGRCCKYEIIDELAEERNSLAEKPVYGDTGEETEETDDDQPQETFVEKVVNVVKTALSGKPLLATPTPTQLEHYLAGYKNGRNQIGIDYSMMESDCIPYYEAGYKDGRGKKAKQFK